MKISSQTLQAYTQEWIKRSSNILRMSNDSGQDLDVHRMKRATRDLSV